MPRWPSYFSQSGSLGNVRTTTLRAHPEAEYRKIIGELG